MHGDLNWVVGGVKVIIVIMLVLDASWCGQ